jgi:hypothetical protein
MPEADYRNRTVGEGKSRTARVHVFEESDSGTVPMNHSNKSGEALAESEEGRRSSRQGCESGGVRVPVPSIACVRTVSMSGACGGNEARYARM